MNFTVYRRSSFFILTRLFNNSFRFYSNEIKIPEYKIRDSTDLLKTLNTTIGIDSTAPLYKYVDDPYMHPYNASNKKINALSREAGRNAAKYIRDRHNVFFQHKVSDPFIESFAPKPHLRMKEEETKSKRKVERTEISETTLNRFISDIRVSDAIEVYKALKEQNVTVSKDTLLSFLEFLCFFNCENPLDEELTEQHWYNTVDSIGEEKIKNKWKTNGLAKEVFAEIDPPNSLAYCSLIKGMCKFGAFVEAWEVWNELCDKNLSADLETYNFITQAVLLRYSSSEPGTEEKWKTVEELLKQMKENGIRPNQNTFNSLLQALSYKASWSEAPSRALNVWKEFTSLDIKPSLASYYFLLKIFLKQRRTKATDILPSILDDISNRGDLFSIMHPSDICFFSAAMDVCSTMKNPQLAFRVNDLYCSNNNSDFIGNAYFESNYYRTFFILLCRTGLVEELMEKFYLKLVPNVYTPNYNVMQEILTAINRSGSMQYIPRLWLDINRMTFYFSRGVMRTFLNVLALNPPDKLDQIEEMGDIVWNLVEIMKEQQRKRDRFTWTIETLSNALIVLTRSGNLHRSSYVVSLIKKQDDFEEHSPNLNHAIKSYFDLCVKDNNMLEAVDLIMYTKKIELENCNQLIKELKSKLKIDDNKKILQLLDTGLATISKDAVTGRQKTESHL